MIIRTLQLISFVGIIIVAGFFAITLQPHQTFAADCTITDARFTNNTGGQKPDGWYDAENRPIVNIKITTTGCENQNIYASIVESNMSDSFVEGFTNVQFTVPVGGVVEIQARAGMSYCNSLYNPDCDHYISVSPVIALVDYAHYDTYTAPASEVNIRRLKYNNCTTDACTDNIPWEIIQNETTTPTGSGVCTITSARFINVYGNRPDGWFSDNEPPTVTLQIDTSGCAQDAISVSISERDTGTDDDITVLDNTTFYIPDTGSLQINLKAGEDECEQTALTHDCEYQIEVWPFATNGASGVQDNFVSFNNPQGFLRYDCDDTCDEDWQLISNNGLSNGFDNECNNITGAKFKNVFGEQENTWYREDLRPQVEIEITTGNCAGKKIELQLEDTDWEGDDDIYVFDNAEFIIPDNNILLIRAYAGEDECEQDTGFDCEYSLIATGDSVEYESVNHSQGTLLYDCDGVCDDDWQIIFHTGVDENGVAVYQEFNPENFSADPNDPCYIETNGVGEIDDNCYSLLAPLPGLTNVKNTRIGEYINLIIPIIIGIAGVLAVVMIVVGGIQYMTTDAFAGKSDARETITKAIIGLLIALGSYVILKTINPNLLQIEPNIQTIEYSVEDAPPTLLSNGTFQGLTDTSVSGITNGSPWPIPGQNLISIRNSLPAGITVNKAECSQVGAENCTGMYFTQAMGQQILSMLNQLKTACQNCKIVITGGSEFWLHKSHGPAVMRLDFSINSGANGLSSTDVQNLNKALSNQTSFPSNNQWYTHFPLLKALAEVPSPTSKHWHVKEN